ncbi:MAG: hypothetical protein OXB84_08735 [Halobacteriovoraceae bacterium]|nr:hypothetical protein [Halobacteriovoraceae bacterium]
MVKKIFFIFLLFSGMVAFFLATGPDHPYPYELKDIYYEDLKQAGDADILIIGDRMGEKLTDYVLPVIEKTAGKFKEKLKLHNWSRSREGMHRTLNKLKSLKRWPVLIIYHGASEEFYEKRASIQYHQKILKNLEYLENDLLYSLVATIPIISRLIYHSTQKINLEKFILPNEKNYTSVEKQIQMEIIYKLYQHELNQLIKLVFDNKSRLVLLTTPLNLTLPPGKVCRNSITKSVTGEQKKITAYLEEQAYQKAYALSQALIKKSIGNARSFYLASRAANNLGKHKQARDYGNMATAFDCKTWRSNAVFNAIIQKAALGQQIPLLDFNYLVNRRIKERSFTDNLFPAEDYYLQLAKDIEAVSLQQLKL